MLKYPPEILRLLHIQGFNEAFDEELPKHKTQFEAYMAVEELHERYFTFPKYSDFQSFRNCRYALLAKNKENAHK